jgi:hypothetical protein
VPFDSFGWKKAKPVVAATGFEVGVYSPHRSSKLMEKKPNSDEDYIIIFVRLPTRLLLQLGRWVLVASSIYVLLHK